MEVIDCRGMACPQPVIATKQALGRLIEKECMVIVDNSSSCSNVERFAQSQGCQIEIERKGEDFYLHIRGTDEDKREEKTVEPHREIGGKIVVYVNSDLLGGGDEALGAFLMKAFLKTLLDLENRPSRLILVNGGVRLASDGSKALETLQTLSERGVEVVSCGTCIDFYKLNEKIRVGTVSNMFEIIQSMLEADHVIRP